MSVSFRHVIRSLGIAVFVLLLPAAVIIGAHAVKEQEPEQGTLTGGALARSDTTASGGQYVQLGATVANTPTNTPGSTATHTPTRTPTPTTPVGTASPTQPPSAISCNKYVSLSGNDSNAGTAASPWRNINASAPKLSPGDTLCVRGGSYTESVRIQIYGTATQKITIAAHPGETVTFTGVPFQIGAWQQDNRSGYLIISGFRVVNSPGYGVLHFGNHNRLENMTVTGSQQGGILVDWSTDLDIVGVTASNNVLAWQNTSQPGGWPPAIGLKNSSYVRLRNNTVHNNWGEGMISYDGTHHNTFSNNTVYDNWSVNMYLDRSYGSVIENNFIYETNTTDPGNKNLAHGISIADEPFRGDTTCELRDNIIRNNLVVNTSTGISNFNYLSCTGLINSTVENNTFVNQWDQSIRLLGAGNANSSVRNNIAYPRGGLVLEMPSPNNTTFTNNLFYFPGGNINGNSIVWSGGAMSFATWSTRPNVTGSVWGDPLFANRGGFAPTDYRTSLGSASGKGANVDTVGAYGL